MTHPEHPPRDRAWFGTAVGRCGLQLMVLAVALTGCNQPDSWQGFGQGRSRRSLPTVTDRLRDAYPDLASNRFLVLADFERPEHGQIFTMLTPQGGGYFHTSTRRSRPETGAGSLEVHFGAARDVLIARDDPSGDWTLPADWRPYSLLLMSIYHPEGMGTVTLEVLGRNARVGYHRPGIVLSPGWNTVRVDLADVARWVNLDQVSEIRWRPTQFTEPTTWYLDDMILADNRVEVLGSPDGPAGDMFVVHEGQRIRVGVSGRFELVFAGGEIVGWYDLRRDPARDRNCVNWPSAADATLGPMPIVLRAAGAGPGDFPGEQAPSSGLDLDGDRGWSPLGRYISSRQRLVEANALRVVVACERAMSGGRSNHPESPKGAADDRADSAGGDGASTRSLITTQYTVTPMGRVFVHITCPSTLGDWRAEELAVAFTTSLEGGFEPLCHSAPLAAAEPESAPVSFVLFARGRGRPGSSDLLCVAHDPGDLPDAVVLESDDEYRVAAMLRASRLRRPVQEWALAMVVWPDDIDDVEEAALLAADYCYPPHARMDVGTLVRTDPGDLDNDGFNEGEGCFVIEPAGTRARVRLEVGEHPCWHPMFKLRETAGRNAWAYADGEILKTSARSADGSILFRLDRIVDRPVEIEVMLQADSAPADGGAAAAAPGA
ncbi:MAG: hypothetical protein JSU68_09780 [Phycisphaerales bacterium]|nr:MAG: hypothetical protein JSU68_09780 [Phycisphaerales bacterium]